MTLETNRKNNFLTRQYSTARIEKRCEKKRKTGVMAA